MPALSCRGVPWMMGACLPLCQRSELALYVKLVHSLLSHLIPCTVQVAEAFRPRRLTIALSAAGHLNTCIDVASHVPGYSVKVCSLAGGWGCSHKFNVCLDSSWLICREVSLSALAALAA